IHIDIDPHEIGKNYPTAVGIAADVKPTIGRIVAGLDGTVADRTAYLSEFSQLKAEWEAMVAPRRDSAASPMTSQRPLAELRKVPPRNGTVPVGSGNPQGTMKQSFEVYEPRTHMTS